MHTDDAHWCGLLYAKNRLGESGWVHAYARYGQAHHLQRLRRRRSQGAHRAGRDDLAPRVLDLAAHAVAVQRTRCARTTVRPTCGRAETFSCHAARARRTRADLRHPFRVASARIQPQSEATIREIATVLRAHSEWRMRSRATPIPTASRRNMVLSVQRAGAVVNDLVKHYGVAPARLTSSGYGRRVRSPRIRQPPERRQRRVELVRL